MINEHKFNKHPKDPKLCKMIRRCITLNRKELGLEFEDVANELGLCRGTLENKLKPSMDMSDLTLTEFIHFLELTGSYEALEYIANEFDLVLIPKIKCISNTSDINTLVDHVSIEGSDVFRVAKSALEDGNLTNDEIDKILKELDESDTEGAKLRTALESIKKNEE